MDKWSQLMEDILMIIRIPIFIMFLVGGVTYTKKKYNQAGNKLYFWFVVLIIITIIAFPIIMKSTNY